MADEWSLEASIERGCLPTGEPIECLYGTGWWTEQPIPDCAPIIQCHKCGSQAYDLGDEIDCENCGIIPLAEGERKRGEGALV